MVYGGFMAKISIDQVFNKVPRRAFLPASMQQYSNIDAPISIGFGQTNSQPYTVKLMLKLLDVKPGHMVLDVGSGSGWTSALLAYLVGKKGRVIAVERIPQLVSFGKRNCQSLGIKNVSFHQASTKLGCASHAPYDRILVSATTKTMPHSLINQLSINGKMVLPIKNSIIVAQKGPGGKLSSKSYPGFLFVPLISHQ